MSVDVCSPLGHVTCSTLTDELCDGILLLGNNRNDNQLLIDKIKLECIQQHASVDTLNLMLLQKYDELRRSYLVKSEIVSSKPIAGLFDTPKEPLTGWVAVHSSIFKLRLVTAMFAMISFAVMSSTNLGRNNFEPYRLLFSTCPYKNLNGRFENNEYKCVLVMGVIAFAYNILYLIWYVLPLDAQKNKYIPVVTDLLHRIWAILLEGCSQIITITLSPRVYSCCGSFYSFLEIILDTALFAISLLFCIRASVTLEDYAEFSFSVTKHYWGLSTSYFTLNSFFATFANTDPPCIDRYHDPSANIRASLAMMYLSVALMALCTLVSIRSFRVRWKRSELEYAVIEVNRLSATAATAQDDPQSREGLLSAKADSIENGDDERDTGNGEVEDDVEMSVK